MKKKPSALHQQAGYYDCRGHIREPLIRLSTQCLGEALEEVTDAENS